MALVTIPYNFTPNTLAQSAQVNANFAALANYLNNGSGVLGNNGYVRLPGGLILQWGTATLVPADGSATATINFPLLFPTGVFRFIPAIDTTSAWMLSCNVGAVVAASATVLVGGAPAGSTVSVGYYVLGN